MPVKKKAKKPAAVATLTDAHLYQQPTVELLFQLIGKEMYSKWNSFGVYLGIKQNVRDGIKQQMQGDPEECFNKLCSKWLLVVFGTGEKPRTWKTVLNAVRECEYPQVADNAEKTLVLRLTKTKIAELCIEKYKDQLESLGLTKKMKQLRDLNFLSSWISFLLSICIYFYPSNAVFQVIIYHLKQAMQRDHENIDVFCTFLRLEFSGDTTAVKIASDMKGDCDRGTSSLKDNVANFIDSEDNRDPVAANTEGCLRSQNKDEGYSAWCSKNGWILSAIILSVLLAFIAAYMMQGSGLQDESVPNLPGLPTAFTGRSEEVEDVLSAFLQKQIQVVAITGGPGYGKSSLAIVCAHKLARKGINVHHILLNEVNTTVRFFSKVLLAFDELHSEKQLEYTVLMQIKALKQTAVLVLDNADLLTLKTSSTMSSFLVLLKKMTSTSSLLKIIVTTRYRFNMINGFRQIHLQALSNNFTIDLLSSLLRTSSVSKSSPATNAFHIQQIANLTGGIPLAVKVVCQLLNSQVISMDEVVEGLSIRPVHTLSHESFSPEERLNKCFNLSYTYLSEPAKPCFVHASRFPVAFSTEAGRAIAAALTTDPDCLPKLVDRSLLEYDVHSKRYSMHLLLRHFVQEQESVRREEFSKIEFQKLYVNFYMDHLLNLSTCMSGSNRSFCKAVFSKIELEYEHFLFSLSLLSQRETNTPVLIPIKRQLEIAEKTFPIIQMPFPPDVLTRWWLLVLKYSCRIYDSYIALQPIYHMPADSPMFKPFVAFARKVGQFWIHLKEDHHASESLYVYEFAFKSTQGNRPGAHKISCEPMREPEYVLLLQDLVNVYKTLNQVVVAQALSDAIDKCECDIRQETDRCFRIINLFPEDTWCTKGLHFIEMMRESPESARVKRYSYIFTLDYLFLLSRCNSPEVAMQEMQDLEANLLVTSEFVDAHTHSKAMLSMSNVWDKLYGNVSREVHWLEKAASVPLGDEPPRCMHEFNQIKFLSHFRLARLYFTKLDNISKALHHSQAAYDLAESMSVVSSELFMPAFRLANLLLANESFNSSMNYFQQAANLLPLLYSSMSEKHYYLIHREIHNRLLKLALLGISLGGVWEYCQWYKADLKSSAFMFKFILTDKYESYFMSLETSLSLSDGTFSKVDADSDVFRIVKTFQTNVHAYSLYVWTLFQILGVCIKMLFIFSFVLAATLYVSCRVTFYSISASLYYYVAILPFSFHYFLYSVIWKGQLWLPTRLPVVSKELSQVYLYIVRFKRWMFICFVVIPFLLHGAFLLLSHYSANRYLSHDPSNSLSLNMDTGLFVDEISVYLQ